MMRRREFITLIGSAVTWPLAADAQGDRMRRIGVLTTFAEDDAEGRAELGAFQKRLEELGWVGGRNVRYEVRRTVGSPERARTFAGELAGMKPDVILVTGGTAASALLNQTRTVPAIFVTDTDPVAAGFVASLARPGGNATGFVSFERTQGPKWLEMLKEIAPSIVRVAILRSDNPQSRVVMPTIKEALPSFGIQGIDAVIHDAADIERHIDDVARKATTGLLVMASTVAFVHRELIVARAALHRLPAVYTNSLFSRSGGLMSYGVDRVEQIRQAGGYADRILRGDNPANLPVQMPTKFELVINLKTAKALGIDVPSRLIALADTVIE